MGLYSSPAVTGLRIAEIVGQIPAHQTFGEGFDHLFAVLGVAVQHAVQPTGILPDHGKGWQMGLFKQLQGLSLIHI